MRLAIAVSLLKREDELQVLGQRFLGVGNSSLSANTYDWERDSVRNMAPYSTVLVVYPSCLQLSGCV